MMSPLDDLDRLTCATFEGDPLALYTNTDENEAWLRAAAAYLQRQSATEGAQVLSSEKDAPCLPF